MADAVFLNGRNKPLFEGFLTDHIFEKHAGCKGIFFSGRGTHILPSTPLGNPEGDCFVVLALEAVYKTITFASHQRQFNVSEAMKNLDSFDFANKKALIRVDFNVPLNADYDITDDTRIRAALPTIQKVLEKGGSVILMSHLGRPQKKLLPDGSIDRDRFTLRHTLGRLGALLEVPVAFASDCIGEKAKEKVAEMGHQSVLLLENLRFYKEESAGDEGFAKQLAELADVYINDAFGTAHRAHASTAVIARFFGENKMFGTLIEKEIASVSRVMDQPQKPVTAIIGGAKVSSKITIIENLLDKVDNLIIGGGMAYTFAKATGGEVGSSLVEEDYLDTARGVIESAREKGVNLLVPQDSVVADAFDNDANRQTVATNAIADGWMGLDIGPNAIAANEACIANSKTILWNGPMGVFEMENFQAGTREIALEVAKATQNGAFSLVGGGDSVAAINKYELAKQVSHVSTGGGAMLEYLEGKELPGIAAIMN